MTWAIAKNPEETGRQPLYVSDLRHRIALALLGLHRLPAAVRELREAVRCNAQHALALYCLGSALHAQADALPAGAGEARGLRDGGILSLCRPISLLYGESP
jgi:hypothetical protein